MQTQTGIGYVVLVHSRQAFLGKLGRLYSDVRLASVYAEPRSARVAGHRMGNGYEFVVVPVRMTVLDSDIGHAINDLEREKSFDVEPENTGNGKDKAKGKTPRADKAA